MMRALRVAVLARLRAAVPNGCGYAASHCDEGPPDGQPPPSAGTFWVSVHDGEWSQTAEGYVEETFGVYLTVSERINVPIDRIGQKAVEEATKGINDRCNTIRAVMINQKYTIMNAANTTINALTDGPYDGFNEPLFYEGATGAELVTGDWFHGAVEKAAGIRKTLRFGRARRLQKIGSVQ